MLIGTRYYYNNNNNNETSSSAVGSLSIWWLFDEDLMSNKDAIWLLRALKYKSYDEQAPLTSISLEPIHSTL